MHKGNILVVDDEPEIRGLVKDILVDEGYEVVTADGAMQARAACMGRKPDLVLLDIWMPGTDGISLLKEWGEADELPFRVVMMSGHGSIETAVEATRLGAYDFLEKPLSMAKLLVTVERAIEVFRLEQENRGLRRTAIELEGPIGSSDAMSRLREQAQAIAKHDSPVLLTGEAGSGKETLARHIHYIGPRKDGPFVTLRVGAIASENLEAAIFGREHSGQVYYGHLEQAHGGTLFLDEVADMDSDTQARLLSALQASAFLRVDGAQAVSIDVRVIGSTRTDPEAAVRDGRVREDLYFFLNVLPVSIPALREHVADIPEIVGYYTDFFVRCDDLPRRAFTESALARLGQYTWPGNIRELKNLIQRMMILGQGQNIQDTDVQKALGTLENHPVSAADMDYSDEMMSLPIRQARELFERDYLMHQWEQAGGNMSQLAKKIGMERTHLYRKLKSLGINYKKPVKEE